MHDFKFIVYTRFGLYVYKRSWYENQLEVLKRYLLPSLKNQDEKDFIWIIAVDEYCPKDIVEELRLLISGSSLKFFIVIYKRKENGRFPKIGSTEWLFEEALDKIGRSNIFSSPDEYYISAMIDCDDAWHRSTVGKVRNIMKKKIHCILGKEAVSAYLVSPSGGLVLTFQNGLCFCEKEKVFYSEKKDFHSMSVFVLSKVLAGISCHSSRHLQWEEFHKVVGFEKIAIETENPMWIYSLQSSKKNNNGLHFTDFYQVGEFGLDSLITLDYPSMSFDLNIANRLQKDFFVERYKYLMSRYRIPSD